jgi:hypothetical protein
LNVEELMDALAEADVTAQVEIDGTKGAVTAAINAGEGRIILTADENGETVVDGMTLGGTVGAGGNEVAEAETPAEATTDEPPAEEQASGGQA